ncbi:hypothetical protein H5410_057467 [Solanum commersonii]|uniref:Uncharacterized protein n=1 Tax=Solanum commersonii TaxID=4109 RepID=A0A9J5WPT5_SOLCO|nr:hypothetical protein H5410_057467 [Solanum commersonii]
MKIDGKRRVINEISGAIVPMTPKEKVSKELKNLEPTSNFISFGTRSRGGNLWPKIWRNSKIDIGTGRKTFFWKDVWVGQHSLNQLHPEIYNLNQQ